MEAKKNLLKVNLSLLQFHSFLKLNFVVYIGFSCTGGIVENFKGVLRFSVVISVYQKFDSFEIGTFLGDFFLSLSLSNFTLFLIYWKFYSTKTMGILLEGSLIYFGKFFFVCEQKIFLFTAFIRTKWNLLRTKVRRI